MIDLIYVAVIIGLFLMSLLYVTACKSLNKGGKGE